MSMPAIISRFYEMRSTGLRNRCNSWGSPLPIPKDDEGVDENRSTRGPLDGWIASFGCPGPIEFPVE